MVSHGPRTADAPRPSGPLYPKGWPVSPVGVQRPDLGNRSHDGSDCMTDDCRVDWSGLAGLGVVEVDALDDVQAAEKLATLCPARIGDLAASTTAPFLVTWLIKQGYLAPVSSPDAQMGSAV